ncbi:hypothetical protein DH2020_029050 [Rehmannia glutinosa]|uniref:Protein decapping 5-like n=1 Tax=Rehmannia glutinosa TaxID=99300 RepID=A0ABR0VPQ7_REHGL
MAKEPSSISYNATSPSSSSTADSYIGSFISVTSKCEIRYEGVLYYLNPEDSTFGLKDVRSYGTEGRKTNGQQVPPSDKVYEYILFRGSDIKDLQVKTAPPVQIEEPIYNDPAIIQSNYYMGPSSSSNSLSATVGSSTEYNLYTEPSVSNARSHPVISPSHHSGTQLGILGSSQLTHSAAPSYGMSTQWQGYSGAPGSITGAQQQSLSSTLFPLQNQASTTREVTNLSNNVSPGHLLATPSSIYLTATPTLTPEQLSTPFPDSVSSKPSFPFHHSTLINSNGLTMPFSLTYQNASSIEAQVVSKVAPDPASFLPVQSLPNSMPSVSDPISDPLFGQQQQVLLTPNVSQSKLSEQSLYPDQKDIGVTSSISLNFSSSAATPAVQPPLLPLPPPSQKLHSLQFTEEFDFEAMNEKFKKDEVWGYLGKANQRDKVEGIQENGTSTLDSGYDNPEMISKTEPKAAYNKDDFFDTISRNSIGRGARNGQNRFSEREKLDSETFGNSQRRSHFGYGGHRGGRGGHHGPYNWGKGYNYGNRGRGGYMLR